MDDKITHRENAGLFPLTHPQRRIVINQQIFPNSKFAHMYGKVCAKNHTAKELSDAINSAIFLFDCLRVNFIHTGSEILQTIADFRRENIELKPSDFDFLSERIDLFRGKLYRFYIIEEDDGKPSGYFFAFHHAVADAYTITLIIKHIEDYLSGNAADSKSYSCRGFAMGEREYLQSEAFHDDRIFFGKKLRRPSNYQYIPEFDLRCERIERGLSGERSRTMLSFCKRKKISLFKLVYASLFLLLYQENGKTTQIISTTHHNRNTEDLLKTGGMLTSTIPVAEDIDFLLTFDEFLDKSSANISESLERHRFPIDLLLSEVKAGSPFDINITEVMLNSIPFGGGSRICRFSPGEDISDLNFKLNPNSKPKGSNIEIAVDFRTGKYTKAQAAGMLDRLVSIASMFIEHGGAVISDVLAPRDDVIARIQKAIEDNPDKLAAADGNTSLTYRQLGERIDAVASSLSGAGHVVGVASERTVWYVAAVLGVLKAGKAFTPLDLGLPKSRLDNIAKQTRMKTLLTYSDDGVKVGNVDTINVANLKPVSGGLPVRVGGLAYILFTSGSSGTPKGALVGRQGLLSLLKALQTRYGIKKDDRFSAYCDFSFDVSVAEIFLPLFSEAALFIANDEQRHDLRLLDDFMRDNGINHAFLPTKAGEAFIKNFPDCPISTLTVAGEKITYYSKTAYQVYNGYGPTEFTVLSHVGKVAEKAARYSIGPPLGGVTDMIVDDSGQPSDVGELVLIGEQAAFGYLNDYSKTADRFVKIASPDGASYQRAYKTGDRVERAADGKIYFLSRMDRQIKLSGYRIELGEIEAAAVDSSLVAAAVCTFDGKEITLSVVPADRYDKEKLIHSLSERLPGYSMPRRILAVSDFPKTKTGKTDYAARTNSAAKGHTALGLTATERKIMRAFSGHAPKFSHSIGVTDDIFQAGIDSIDIIQIMLGIEKKLRYRIGFTDFLRCPTVRELAAFIDSRKERGCVRKMRGGEGRPLVLIFDLSMDVISYKRLLDELDPSRPVYGIVPEFIPKNVSLPEYTALLVGGLLTEAAFDCYDLAGYSSGGVVAMEMARQLGEKAGHVFLADSPNYKKYPKFLNYGFIIGNLPSILSAYGLRGVFAYGRKCLSDLFKRKNLISEGLKLIKMLREYDPDSFDHPATLFVSSGTAARTDDMLGWRTLIRPVNIVHLGGGHVSTIKKEARKIAEIIDEKRTNHDS